MAVVAHVGHWYAELLYVAPVVGVGAWLLVANRRDKRRARSAAERPGATPDRAA